MKTIGCDDEAHRMLADAVSVLIGVAVSIETRINGSPPAPGTSGTIVVDRQGADGGLEFWTITVSFEGTQPRGTTH